MRGKSRAMDSEKKALGYWVGEILKNGSRMQKANINIPPITFISRLIFIPHATSDW